jgi:hypothetical protein
MKLSKDMPPAFLGCGENDRDNTSQGLPELYVAMKKACGRRAKSDTGPRPPASPFLSFSASS